MKRHICLTISLPWSWRIKNSKRGTSACLRIRISERYWSSAPARLSSVAGEFDYAGTQACRVLKEEGVEVVLVNSNPATIMTDTDIADKVYLEPLTVGSLEKIIDRERPDSLLASLGGQTGLNLAMELDEKGILQKYNVQLLGTKIDSIRRAEDREDFKNMMLAIGEPCIDSVIVHDVQASVVLPMSMAIRSSFARRIRWAERAAALPRTKSSSAKFARTVCDLPACMKT